MAKEFFSDLPNTTTPIRASRLNGLLDGEEAMGSIVVDDVSGKNLFDLGSDGYTVSGVSITNSGSTLTLNGTTSGSGHLTKSRDVVANENYRLIKKVPAGTYTISSTLRSGSFTLNSKAFQIYFYDASGTQLAKFASSYLQDTKSFTVNSETTVYIDIYENGSGLVFTNCIVDFQLELGSTATNYVPYRKIIKEENGYVKENTTFYANDFKCKNLVDVSNITSATGISRSGDVITLNGNIANISWTLSKPIILKANTTYTLSLTNVISDTTEGRFILRNGETNIVAVYFNNANKQVQYTPTSDTTIDTLRIFGAGTTYSNYSFSVQLEIGSQATSYTEYKNFDNEYKYDIIQNQDVAFTETAQSFPFNITKYDRIRVAVNNSYNRTYFVYFEKNDILGNTSIYQKILDFTDNANFSSLVAGRITLNTTSKQISIVYDKKNSTFPLTLKSIVGYYR